jgi:hypothetical protein
LGDFQIFVSELSRRGEGMPSRNDIGTGIDGSMEMNIQSGLAMRIPTTARLVFVNGTVNTM